MEEKPKPRRRSLLDHVLLVLGVVLVLVLLAFAWEFLSFLRGMNGLR